MKHPILRCFIDSPQSCAVPFYPERWAPPRRGLLHDGLSALDTASYMTDANIMIILEKVSEKVITSS